MSSGRGTADLRLFTHAFQAMGGPCELHLYAPDAERAQAGFKLAQGAVERLEQKYSRYRPDSVISRINATAGGAAVAVDQETAGLIGFAAQAWEQSEGLFDPSSGVLRQVWDFRTGRMPTEAELEGIRPRVGWERIDWKAPEIRLPSGMELDFGGFVKEYAADAAALALLASGWRHGLVNLGGDLRVLGPHPDGAPWQLGVRHPRQPDTAIAQIPLFSGALSSSGDYERYFERDGQRFCHILNPRTGWPSGELAAVSVVAPDCLIAGVASTVAMLLPQAEAMGWLDRLGLAWLAISPQGEVHQSASSAAHPAS